MGKGDRNDQIRLMARNRAADTAKRTEAMRIIEIWNAELEHDRIPLFSPTLECAFLAGRPWLRVSCPGCQQEYEIDLRLIVRPKDFPIMALRAAMVCESMCRGEAQSPTLLGLYAVPFDRKRITWQDVRGW